jgi:hypothetical protein
VFFELAQLDTPVIGCPLNGTGLGFTVTWMLPFVTGAGAGVGAGAAVGEGAVGDEVSLHVAVMSAATQTINIGTDLADMAHSSESTSACPNEHGDRWLQKVLHKRVHAHIRGGVTLFEDGRSEIKTALSDPPAARAFTPLSNRTQA